MIRIFLPPFPFNDRNSVLIKIGIVMLTLFMVQGSRFFMVNAFIMDQSSGGVFIFVFHIKKASNLDRMVSICANVALTPSTHIFFNAALNVQIFGSGSNCTFAASPLLCRRRCCRSLTGNKKLYALHWTGGDRINLRNQKDHKNSRTVFKLSLFMTMFDNI